MEKVLRASSIGFECLRHQWYCANGVPGKEPDKRLQRIFDMGHMIEDLAVKWLRNDGWEIDHNKGSQEAEQEIIIPVDSGFIKGHHDIIMTDFSGKKIVGDIKSMNSYFFREWKRKGSAACCPQYRKQLYVYGKGFNINDLAIIGVNKDNSEYHIEFFDLDEQIYGTMVENARRVFASKDPIQVDKVNDWQCNYCWYNQICDLVPEKMEVRDTSIQIHSEQMLKDIETYQSIATEIRELEKLQKDIRREIDATFIDQGVPVGCVNNRYDVVYNERNRTGFDSKKLKEERPEVFKEYETKSTYYVLKISEKENDNA